MEGDGLPSQVCFQCVHYISRAYSFKLLCERSDATLRQYLGKPILTELTSKDIIPLVPVQILEPQPDTVNQIFIPITEEPQPIVPPPKDEVLETKEEVFEPKVEITENDHGSRKYTKYIFINRFTTLKFKGDDTSDEETQDETNDTEKNKKPGRKRKPKDDTEQPIYPCEDCTQCFTTLTDLKVHARTHPKDSRQICKVCNQSFANASTLCRHMKVI